MSASTLGRRYARALLDLAAERGVADKVSNDLRGLGETWATSADLRGLFENPSVPSEARKQVLDALASRAGLDPLVRNVLHMLADRRRMRHMPDVIDAYEELAEARAGRVRAEVVTATRMGEAYYGELQRVLEDVTGKKVTLVRREDPTLIAGVVTRVGDKVFDGSVKNRLDELRSSLLSM